MTPPSATLADGQPAAPARLRFLQRLQVLAIKPDIRTVQDLMGHASVGTTMIYRHVMKRPGAGAPGPLDFNP